MYFHVIILTLMIMKKLLFPVFFISLGTVSLLGQVVILREITSLFYGNELFYCFGLGGWLFFTGLGSLLAGRIKLPKNKPVFPWLILAALFLLIPLSIILLRLLVAGLVSYGQLPSFGFSLFILTSVLFVFCFPLGMIFGWTVDNKSSVNKAYFWETAGLTLAGLVFSFFLSATSFPLMPWIDKTSLGWRYKNLTQTIYSKYNQILITKDGRQQNYYLNGQLAFSNQDRWEIQQLLKLLRPFIKKNQKNIVLGNPNIAREMKNQKVKGISYLEIDSQLAKLEKGILNKGVNLIVIDPRRFFRESREIWDVIFFSLGNPQTLLTNRYFTRECFSLVKNRLAEKGVFILILYIPTDYTSEEALGFGRSVYQTFAYVFPHQQLLIFNDQLILIGSKNFISLDQSKIDSYWQKNFWQSVEGWRRNEIIKKITKTKEAINSDTQPVAFFHQQLFWHTMFSFATSRLTLLAGEIVPIIFFLILMTIYFQKKNRLRLAGIMASSSFILMGIETLIIFMFQTKIGYLYSQIALIFASILLGMTIGTKLKIKNERLKIILFGYLIIISIFVLIIIGQLETAVNWPIFWYLLAFLAGLSGGAIFALINRLYLIKENNLGYIYAFDLFGG